jgi:hypothetical protein
MKPARYILICLSLLGSLCCANSGLIGQEQQLPKHAVWRIGEFGKTPKAIGIYRLQYSSDGKLLATRDRENVITIYEVESKAKLCEVMAHENNFIETIDFSADGEYFMTAAGSSEKVKIWKTQSGKLHSDIETDARAAYFSQDGTEVVVLGTTHVERYSFPGVQMVGQRKWRTGNEQRAGMSRDGRLVIAFRSNGRSKFQTTVIDLENKSRIDLRGPDGIPKPVAVSPNNLWVAATYRDEKVDLWDLRDPHRAKYTLVNHKETVQSLSFSADNRFLVSAGWDQKAVAWDLLTRQAIAEFEGHTEHLNASAISPLDFTFATGASGTTDTSVIIWDFKPMLFRVDRASEKGSFKQLWNGMGASSIRPSLAATAGLVDREAEFLPMLIERIEKETGNEAGLDLIDLIQRLDHPKFARREKAMKQLMLVRAKAEVELRRALEQTISTETRFRIGKILKTAATRPNINFTDLRRWHRIVMALERMNNPAAQAGLLRIANGHADIDVSTAAKEAIMRNEMRAKF